MKKNILSVLGILFVLFCVCLPASAQMTLEERDIIIEEIMKRMDVDSVIDQRVSKAISGVQTELNQVTETKLENMKAEIKNSIKSELKTELKDELKKELKEELLNELKAQTAVQTTTQEAAPQQEQAVIQNNSSSATSSSKQTYAGPHATMVNSYAYKTGGSADGGHTYLTEYYPNELFTVDVVFENDGNMALPTNMELRHTGNNGEYTGHTESAYAYDKNVKPGERVGFSFAAHGSENIGTITFYWQLYDADTGKAVPGGYGYFTYVARP